MGAKVVRPLLFEKTRLAWGGCGTFGVESSQDSGEDCLDGLQDEGEGSTEARRRFGVAQGCGIGECVHEAKDSENYGDEGNCRRVWQRKIGASDMSDTVLGSKYMVRDLTL